MLALHLPKSQTEAIPQIVTYAVGEKGMEYKGKFQQNHDTNIGAAAVGEKVRLGMKRR